MLWKRGDSHRNSELSQRLLSIVQRETFHFRTQGVRTDSSVLRCRLGKKNGELLAAIAAAYVCGTKEIAKQVGQRLEHHVPGIVSERVIESLEVIEIEKEDCDGLSLATRKLQLSCE